MTGVLELYAIAQTSTVRIVDCLIEGSFIALFAGIGLRLLPRQSSGLRFAVWFSALMAIAASPLLSIRMWSQGSSLSAHGMSRSLVTLPNSWALYIFGAWAAITAWCLLRVAAGLWHMFELRNSCAAVDPTTLDPLLRATLDNGGGRRPVTLCVSDRVQVPAALGLMAPLVIVPHWITQELSPDELNQILLHEVAHLRRWDDWTNLAQKLVKALFFFHPAVWWIERHVSLEREMACDDAVVAKTAKPRAYAECLTRLAEKTFVHRSLQLAQAALGRVRHTSLRVAQILDIGRPRTSRHVWTAAVPLVAGFAIACAMFAAKAPQLIAFRNEPAASGPRVSTPAIAVSTSPLRPMPAAFQRADAHVANTVSRWRVRRVAPAKNKALNRKLDPAGLEDLDAAFVFQRSITEQLVTGANLLHLAAANPASMTSTETLFLLVAYPSTDRAHTMTYEIQVWHVTVFHPGPRSAHKDSSRKET